MIARVARYLGPLFGKLQEYLCSAYKGLREHPDFPDAMSGHFPGKPVSNARISELMECINTIAGEEESWIYLN